MVQGRMNAVVTDLSNCMGKIFEPHCFALKLIISFGWN